jgi:hypothetical protein
MSSSTQNNSIHALPAGMRRKNGVSLRQEHIGNLPEVPARFAAQHPRALGVFIALKARLVDAVFHRSLKER